MSRLTVYREDDPASPVLDTRDGAAIAIPAVAASPGNEAVAS